MNKEPEIIIEDVKASPEELMLIKDKLVTVFKTFINEEAKVEEKSA